MLNGMWLQYRRVAVLVNFTSTWESIVLRSEKDLLHKRWVFYIYVNLLEGRIYNDIHTIHTYVYIVYMYTHIYVYKYMYINIYTYIYTHTQATENLEIHQQHTEVSPNGDIGTKLRTRREFMLFRELSNLHYRYYKRRYWIYANLGIVSIEKCSRNWC